MMQTSEITYQMNYYEMDNLVKQLRAVILKLQGKVDTLERQIQNARRALNYYPSDCKTQIDSRQSRIRSYEREIQDLNNQIRYIEELISDLSNLVSTTQSVDLFLRDQIMNVFRTGGGFSSQYLPGHISGMPTSLYEKYYDYSVKQWIASCTVFDYSKIYEYTNDFLDPEPVYLEKGKLVGHLGVDLADPNKSINPLIFAVLDGYVVSIKDNGGNGYRIIIQTIIDGRKINTILCHMKLNNGITDKLKEGERISSGQEIGIMGNTGTSTGVHLHLAVVEGELSSEVTNPWGYQSQSNCHFEDVKRIDEHGNEMVIGSKNLTTGTIYYDYSKIAKYGLNIIK